MYRWKEGISSFGRTDGRTTHKHNAPKSGGIKTITLYSAKLRQRRYKNDIKLTTGKLCIEQRKKSDHDYEVLINKYSHDLKYPQWCFPNATMPVIYSHMINKYIVSDTNILVCIHQLYVTYGFSSLFKRNFLHYAIYSISQEICTRFCCALLCCGYAIVHNEFTWSIYPYSSGMLCWHWGNR